MQINLLIGRTAVNKHLGISFRIIDNICKIELTLRCFSYIRMCLHFLSNAWNLELRNILPFVKQPWRTRTILNIFKNVPEKNGKISEPFEPIQNLNFLRRPTMVADIFLRSCPRPTILALLWPWYARETQRLKIDKTELYDIYNELGTLLQQEQKLSNIISIVIDFNAKMGKSNQSIIIPRTRYHFMTDKNNKNNMK